MERKRGIALAAAAALIVAAVVVYRARSVPPEATPTSRPQAAGSAASKQPPKAQQPAAELNLEALNAQRPKPVETNRNPFRFKPKPPPPPPPPPPQPVVTQPAQPAGGPPPPPPIPLKFIGKVESGKAGLVAVLSDSRGVYQGRQGDIIEGRYRILRIGVESVDLAYLDGRGRQTIRLTGQ